MLRSVFFLLSYLGAVLPTDGTGPVMTNVALGKFYSQSSYHPGFSGSPSSHAANGNTNGIYDHNNCIHTEEGKGDRTPFWQVDLGKQYTLSMFTVWGRTEFEQRLYPFSITVDGRECVRVSSGARSINVSCDEPMFGQTVRIERSYHRNDETLNLCEFQIWVPSELVNCPPGYFGKLCDENCSPFCGKREGKRFCYQTSGVCADECSDGHFGDTCDKTCRDNCVNDCDKTTGACKTEKESDTGKIIGAVVGSVLGLAVVVLIAVGFLLYYLRRRRRQDDRTVEMTVTTVCGRMDDSQKRTPARDGNHYSSCM